MEAVAAAAVAAAADAAELVSVSALSAACGGHPLRLSHCLLLYHHHHLGSVSKVGARERSQMSRSFYCDSHVGHYVTPF
jgi:hypothetical protein